MRSRLGRLAAVFGMVVSTALVVPTVSVQAAGLVSGSTGVRQSTDHSVASASSKKKAKKAKKTCQTPNSPTSIPPKC